MIIRRELSENFCFYNKNYDSIAGAENWAQITLNEHRYNKIHFLICILKNLLPLRVDLLREKCARGQRFDIQKTTSERRTLSTFFSILLSAHLVFL